MLRFYKHSRDGGIVCHGCLDDMAAVELDPRYFPGTWTQLSCSRCGTQARPPSDVLKRPVHRPAAPARHPRLAVSVRPPPDGVAARGALVLLIEDDDMVRLALEMTLSHHGYHVCAVASGESAVRAVISAGRPSVVVTDWRLGGRETGRDVLRKLRPVIGRVPAIILTGETQRRPFTDMDSLDADVLIKPVTTGHILATIARRLPPQPTTPP